jgi:hypothetical protein
VGPADLGLVLAWWGAGSTGGDVNGDGDTNALDIGDLLAAWTG